MVNPGRRSRPSRFEKRPMPFGQIQKTLLKMEGILPYRIKPAKHEVAKKGDLVRIQKKDGEGEWIDYGIGILVHTSPANSNRHFVWVPHHFKVNIMRGDTKLVDHFLRRGTEKEKNKYFENLDENYHLQPVTIEGITF